MSYVPAVPGFTPVSYGQGYGDWHQYAGYTKDKPFGASPAFLSGAVAPKAPTAKILGVPPIEQQKPVDYSIASTGQMGSPAKTQLGNFSNTQLGQVQDLMSILKNDEENF